MSGEKIVITLSKKATENYMKWARGISEAEGEADCEPGDRVIRIDIGPIWCPSTASSIHGEEFGDVEIEFIDSK